MTHRSANGRFLMVVPLLLAAGCATVPTERSFERVQATVGDRVGTAIAWPTTPEGRDAIDRRVEEVLSEPLDAERAVMIALLNNRELRAQYARLGLADADLVEAGLLENPRLSAGLGFPDSPPSMTGIDLGITLSLLRAIMAPARKDIAGAQLDAEVLSVSDEVVRTAAETRTVFLEYQAAEHIAEVLGQIADAADASREFARRLHEAGNLSALDLANEQSLYEQARLEHARSMAEAADRRERLNAQLGLWGPQTGWSAVTRLPALPVHDPDLGELESLAVRQRLDLAAAAKEVEAISMAAGLQRNWKWLLTTEVGVNGGRDTDGQWVVGPEVSVELPIFDQRQAEIARLDAALLASEAHLEGLAIQTRADVRRLRGRLVATRYEVEHLRDTVLPLRERITALTLEEYNFMLVDTFALLAAKREEIAAERAYLDGLRDYWIVRAELERAVGGRLPDGSATNSPVPPGEPATQPHNDGGHHHAD